MSQRVYIAAANSCAKSISKSSKVSQWHHYATRPQRISSIRAAALNAQVVFAHVVITPTTATIASKKHGYFKQYKNNISNDGNTFSSTSHLSSLSSSLSSSLPIPLPPPRHRLLSQQLQIVMVLYCDRVHLLWLRPDPGRWPT